MKWSNPDLEWLSGLEDEAVFQADCLSDALGALAVASPSISEDQLSNILFGFASQTKTVSSLIYISSESGFLASELKKKTNGPADAGRLK